MFTKFAFAVYYGHYSFFFLRMRYAVINLVFRNFFIISLNVTETELFKVLRKP